jgi:hypothetical protein
MGRGLRREERDIARQVFQSSIPYCRVEIHPGIGIGGAPFTLPFPLPIVSPIALGYIIHAGAEAFFAGMHTTDASRATLIHELTHVWQGVHGLWSTQFVHSSVIAQGRAIAGGNREDVYIYTAGLTWDEYNVEQQARIVQDWFTGGMDTSSPLFPYIRDELRDTSFNF